jgi:hypothetical protein
VRNLYRRLPVILPAALILGTGIARSTEIIPPTFDELVAKAETIFVGQAVDRRCEWQWSPQGRSIVTLVTFKVERVLKGQSGPQMELEFLGGTIGDVALRVGGMPEFHTGDRDVLFVLANRKAVSPLVGFGYGRFRIIRDPVSGADEVRTHDGRPFVGVASAAEPRTNGVVRPITPLPTPQVVRSLSFAEFQAMVQLKVAERAR